MTKYTRKQINKNASLHTKEFVIVDNVAEMMQSILTHAIECGANEDKLLSMLEGYKPH
jgi:hypothetical protein